MNTERSKTSREAKAAMEIILDWQKGEWTQENIEREVQIAIDLTNANLENKFDMAKVALERIAGIRTSNVIEHGKAIAREAIERIAKENNNGR